MTSPKIQAATTPPKIKEVATANNQLEGSTDGKHDDEEFEKAILAGTTVEEEEILYDLTEDSPSSEAGRDADRTEAEVDQKEPPKSQSGNAGDENLVKPSPKSGDETPDSGPVEAYVENDPLMASLAEHMDKAMAFGAPAVTNVQVPRGYIFDFEITGPEFWRAHDNAHRGTKRKHEDEDVAQRHGFLAEDVIRYGAVQMPGARYPNLTNEIHPLFQRNAFDGCEDEVYEQFLPGLRLASMFLTQPTCSHFWVTLAWGERFIDQQMTNRMGRLQHRIPKDSKVTADSAIKVIEYIQNIAKTYRVHFTFVQRMMAGGIKWSGLTQKVENYSCEVEWSTSQKKDPADSDLLRIHTRLSSDWYVAAKKLSKLKFPETAQLLRFNFGFAILITHEICHAIELAHIRTRPEWVPDSSWNAELQQEIGHEPFFHDNHVPELGYTWENYVFGGKVWPINDRMDCLHGLCITDWPIRSTDIWDSSKVEYHTIPMTYIEPLFQMQTWEQQDLDISNSKLWHIRRDGARSIYLHSFTTMDYNEEQRIKNEELEELRMEQERKQPASKKRRTSLADESNAVPLSRTGEEALSATAEEQALESSPKKVLVAVKPMVPLAQRSFRRPILKEKRLKGRTGKEVRSPPRFEGANAEHAARRVGLGSGKKR